MKKYVIVYTIIDSDRPQTGILQNRLYPTLEKAQAALGRQICSFIKRLNVVMDGNYQKWSETKIFPESDSLTFFDEDELEMNLFPDCAFIHCEFLHRIYEIYELDIEAGKFKKA